MTMMMMMMMMMSMMMMKMMNKTMMLMTMRMLLYLGAGHLTMVESSDSVFECVGSVCKKPPPHSRDLS